MNHPLTVVSHGARRAPVTRMGLHPEDFKPCNFNIIDNNAQHPPKRYNT